MAKLTYNVAKFNQDTIVFNPERLDIYIGTQVDIDGVKHVNIETFLHQQLSPERKMTIQGNFTLPMAAVEPMVEKVELGGNVIVNAIMLNEYLKANHNIQII